MQSPNKRIQLGNKTLNKGDIEIAKRIKEIKDIIEKTDDENKDYRKYLLQIEENSDPNSKQEKQAKKLGMRVDKRGLIAEKLDKLQLKNLKNKKFDAVKEQGKNILKGVLGSTLLGQTLIMANKLFGDPRSKEEKMRAAREVLQLQILQDQKKNTDYLSTIGEELISAFSKQTSEDTKLLTGIKQDNDEMVTQAQQTDRDIKKIGKGDKKKQQEKKKPSWILPLLLFLAPLIIGILSQFYKQYFEKPVKTIISVLKLVLDILKGVFFGLIAAVKAISLDWEGAKESGKAAADAFGDVSKQIKDIQETWKAPTTETKPGDTKAADTKATDTKAAGGKLKNQITKVGEKGPELIRGQGTVIPNSKVYVEKDLKSLKEEKAMNQAQTQALNSINNKNVHQSNTTINNTNVGSANKGTRFADTPVSDVLNHILITGRL